MKNASEQLGGHVPDVVSTLKPVGPLAESTPIDVAIALPARDQELRTALLRDIYDPASPRFRQYLTPREYTDAFDPTDAGYQSLLDFAKANELTVVSTAPRKFIHVTAPAAVINTVFHVRMQQYQHPTENRLFYAPDSDPAVELETPVLQITGLDDFWPLRRAPNLMKAPGKGSGSLAHAGGSGNGGLYTGGDFRAAYAPDVTLTGHGQAVGILDVNNGYLDSDIKMYEQKNGLPNVPLQNVYLDGYTGGDPNDESATDIEMVISMAPGIAKVIIYGVPYSHAGIIDALHEMANPTKGEPLPYQITTSYYFFYDKNVYDALARLAVQGQALFVASGDDGSYNETTGKGAFPPADHPLVTCVGGTELQTSGPGGGWTSETTASFSGGGYSPWGADPQFAIPWWQAGMDYTPSKGSTTVRNAPDVSIVAENISVYSNGGWRGFAGTSAAAPLWAGFLALANEQAATSGTPRVGFASPALWAIGRDGNCPTCFHDITTGNNFNKTNPKLYSAVAGYDLCTGWGTPNGKNLIDALVGPLLLGRFEGIVAVAGFDARSDGFQHAIVATSDGKLTEVFWGAGVPGPREDPLGRFEGIVAVAGYDGSDGFRHAVVATSDGKLTEVFWGAGVPGPREDPLGRFEGIVAVAGFDARSDGFQHAIVATSDGKLTEVFWGAGVPGPREDPLGRFEGIVAVAGYDGSDGFRHAVVATSDGKLTEVFWGAGVPGPREDPLGRFEGIVAVAGYDARSDGFRHAIVATSDGKLTEVFWGAGVPGPREDPLGRFEGIVAVAGYDGSDGFRHAVVATSDGKLTEVIWGT